jgi:maleamate amidohydrolase
VADLQAAQKLYMERGFGRRIGFGRWPAILVTDMINGFTDPASPLGSDLDPVVKSIRRLLDLARPKSIPVIFTTVSYEEAERQAARNFITKIPALKVLKAGTLTVEVDVRLERQPSEPVLVKQFASAFFGTALASLLAAEGCDTVIVTGCTTSGCVRASVLDALQHGFRPIVPLEGVGDRAPGPHEANLFDIQAKYGDVVVLDEVVDYLNALPVQNARA